MAKRLRGCNGGHAQLDICQDAGALRLHGADLIFKLHLLLLQQCNGIRQRHIKLYPSLNAPQRTVQSQEQKVYVGLDLQQRLEAIHAIPYSANAT